MKPYISVKFNKKDIDRLKAFSKFIRFIRPIIKIISIFNEERASQLIATFQEQGRNMVMEAKNNITTRNIYPDGYIGKRYNV